MHQFKCTIHRNLISLALALFPIFLHATHIVGGSTSYTCTGPYQYEVVFDQYVDCGAATAPAREIVDIFSNCGASFRDTVWLDFQLEVPQLCAASLPQSICNGGALPSILWRRYSATFTLAACNFYRFSFDQCCRNASAVNLASTSDYYYDLVINTLDAPCNDSPVWSTTYPTEYVLQNQLAGVNMGVYLQGGDSTVFSLVSARSGPTTGIPYNPGYSATIPIPSMTIDSKTGQLSFTPTILGSYVVVVRVDEYNTSGTLIGSTMHDIMITVVGGVNNAPTLANNTVTNVTGDASITGAWEILADEGGSFCYDIAFSDADVLDTLTLSSNVILPFSGGSFSVSGTNPAVLTVCVNLGASDTILNLINNTAADDNCPLQAVLEQKVLIRIAPQVVPVPPIPPITPPTTGIEEYVLDAFIAPNPSSGLVTVSIRLRSGSNTSIKLVDLTGRTVFQTILPTGELLNTLDLQQLGTGNYLVVVEQDNKSAVRKLTLH